VVHREAEIRPSVKYWLKPDFQNRVKEGSIRLLLNAEVKEIRPREVVVEQAGNEGSASRLGLPADFVILYVGYRAVDELLRKAGARFGGPDDAPVLSESYETTTPGLFVAGSAGFGTDTRTVFIENGREHVKVAVGEIERRLEPLNEPV
jgi:thioredoxin reductase (NADPH)